MSDTSISTVLSGIAKLPTINPQIKVAISDSVTGLSATCATQSADFQFPTSKPVYVTVYQFSAPIVVSNAQVSTQFDFKLDSSSLASPWTLEGAFFQLLAKPTTKLNQSTTGYVFPL